MTGEDAATTQTQTGDNATTSTKTEESVLDLMGDHDEDEGTDEAQTKEADGEGDEGSTEAGESKDPEPDPVEDPDAEEDEDEESEDYDAMDADTLRRRHREKDKGIVKMRRQLAEKDQRLANIAGSIAPFKNPQTAPKALNDFIAEVVEATGLSRESLLGIQAAEEQEPEFDSEGERMLYRENKALKDRLSRLESRLDETSAFGENQKKAQAQEAERTARFAKEFPAAVKRIETEHSGFKVSDTMGKVAQERYPDWPLVAAIRETYSTAITRHVAEKARRNPKKSETVADTANPPTGKSLKLEGLRVADLMD